MLKVYFNLFKSLDLYFMFGLFDNCVLGFVGYLKVVLSCSRQTLLDFYKLLSNFIRNLEFFQNSKGFLNVFFSIEHVSLKFIFSYAYSLRQ